jgi:hypothetical protein
MLYPDSSIVENRGYQVVEVDGQFTLEAIDRGRSLDALDAFGVRSCDAVCGCCMLVRSHVFEKVKRFRREGVNRWGELIFAAEAKRLGSKIAVSDHCLFHGGVGTKSNPKNDLRSTSYQVERGPWERVVERYLRPLGPSVRRRNVLEPDLTSRLRSRTTRLLFYGIGTVTEMLLEKGRTPMEQLEFCTGLKEEVGVTFRGRRVQWVGDVQVEHYDWIVLTPLHLGRKLYEKHFRSRLTPQFRGAISEILIRTQKDVNRITYRDLFP